MGACPPIWGRSRLFLVPDTGNHGKAGGRGGVAGNFFADFAVFRSRVGRFPAASWQLAGGYSAAMSRTWRR